MITNRITFMVENLKKFFLGAFLLATLLLSSCNDDPAPINEEEVITTMYVDLTPVGGGASLELKFYDEDGDGSIDPVITPALAQLKSGTTYSAEITLLNETVSPAEDITEEIEAEKNDHLFCFTPSGANVTISYDDEDAHGFPIGLMSTWTVGAAGTAGTVTIVLRHQPGEKTGVCPGPGESDIQVEFDVQVVD